MQLKGKEFREHSSGLHVSSDGEVWFEGSGIGRFPNGHFTYGCTGNRGYKMVIYKYERYLVHRLVAECFIPNPDNLQTIDHINRVKTDNRVDNLRWASMSMQLYNRGKYTRPNTPKNNASSKAVLQYTPDGELVKEWPSAMECGRNGFNQGAVSACCRGKRNKHKDYVWRYKEEELEEV